MEERAGHGEIAHGEIAHGKIGHGADDSRPVARSLHELRAQRLLTAYDLARQAGVDAATILDIEAGWSSRPPPAVIRAIAEALGVEPMTIAELRPQQASTPPMPSRATRVLVVDDDAGVRFPMTRLLEDIGHTVQPAAHGAEALDVLGTWRPDLILLDLNMPVMDGRAFCLEMQRRPDLARPPLWSSRARGERGGLRAVSTGRLRHQAIQPAHADRDDPLGPRSPSIVALGIRRDAAEGAATLREPVLGRLSRAARRLRPWPEVAAM